jgi:DEAD/DEAH box helicase
MGSTSDPKPKQKSTKVIRSSTAGDESLSTKEPKSPETGHTEEHEVAKTGDDSTDGKQAEPSNDSGILTETSFKSLGVCDALCDACDKLGWKSATRIQETVLPEALKGRDIIGLAETGSGKTGAFCLPVLQRLLENPTRGAVFAVFLAPTRVSISNPSSGRRTWSVDWSDQCLYSWRCPNDTTIDCARKKSSHCCSYTWSTAGSLDQYEGL